MASILKIIKGTTSVSLWDATGFSVLVDGWAMAPADETPHAVQEQIRCKLITTGRDNAASQIQALNDLLRDATRYNKHDPIQTIPVYIETQLEGETNKRFALIAGKNAKFRSAPYNQSAVDSNIFREIILTIIREHPWRSHKPGLLPGNIQLTATDGPDYDPDETDYDVDLVSTFGHIPATASGGLIGGPGQFGRGVQLAEATTNEIQNPSAEVNSTDFWFEDVKFTRSTAFAKYGAACFRFEHDPAAPVDATSPNIACNAEEDWVFSMFYREDTASEWKEKIVKVTTSVGATWIKIATLYLNNANKRLALWITDSVGSLYHANVSDAVTTYVYVDAIQLEQKSYPTPYCDGSLGPGHSWSGVAHNSTSSRVAHILKYDIDDLSLKGTVGFRMKTIYEEDEQTGYKRVLSLSDGTANNRLFLMLNPAADCYTVRYYGNGAFVSINCSGSDTTRLTYADVIITWDLTADELKIFVDGTQVSSTITGLTTPSAAWDRLHIGDDHLETNTWSGWIDDLFLLDRVMSEGEVSDRHDSGKAFVGDPNLVMYLPFDGPRQVHITNFRDDVALTHIYNKNEGGAWSDNFVAEQEFTLFPNAVAEDDFVLFGSSDQPPKHIVLNLRTAGDLTDTALVLHYWNGGWVDLVLGEDYTVYPGTTLEEMLESKGNIVINIKPPSDWAKADPGFGTAVYAVILKEQDATPVYATHPVHGGQLVYTAKTNEIRIPAASLHGDAIPIALLRLLSPGGGDENEAFSSLSRIVWGIKSDNSIFTSNLNAGNADNPTGWTVTYGTDSSAGADPRAPGGAWADCDFGGDETLCKRVIFTGVNRLEYWLGAYGVYIKAQQIGGDDEDVSLMLRTYIGSTNVYDPHMDTDTFVMKDTDLGLEVVDLGEINIPFAARHSVDDFSDINIVFEIHASLKTGSAAVLEISELVLIPADEVSGAPDDHAGDIAGGSFALRGDEAIDHDGGIIVRRTNKNAVSGIIHRAVMDWNSGGPFIEIKNLDVASIIYFMLLHYPAGGTWGTGPLIASPGCHLMGELQLHHRYKLLRGND